MSSFVAFWGFAFLVATAVLMFKKERNDNDVAENIGAAYRTAIDIIRLRPVRTYIALLLTVRIMTGSESVAPLKLIEFGVPKERLALIGAIMTPISVAMPSVVSKWIVGPRPLDIYLAGYKARMVSVSLGAIVVYAISSSAGNVSSWLYVAVVAVSVLQTAVSSTMFTAQMAFHNSIARNMTSLGGTYMTLLNTFANMGGIWPSTMALYMTDISSLSRCGGAQHNDEGSIVLFGSCQNLATERSETCADSCDAVVDGYFVVVAVSVAIGVVWHFLCGSALLDLQTISPSEWGIQRRKEGRLA